MPKSPFTSPQSPELVLTPEKPGIRKRHRNASRKTSIVTICSVYILSSAYL
ncbi:hypothetical protein HanLR1_Chr06g0205271 [Helianthus annuus]|nr:hypothetical protein HanHA89_Chr06g0220311 [Helianthus annuus]KAJ0737285.1 hypothetical protein HanLR1_Chr06g0205271 [Helianthus annuus]